MENKPLQRILKLAMALTAFSIGLTLMRMTVLGNIYYAFLIANIVLAWIAPAILLILSRRPRKWYLQLPLWGLWLLFLPNAPYLVTDLIHLDMFGNTWRWFDQIMLFSYALSGILITVTALDLARINFEAFLGRKTVWVILSAASFLCAVGMYLGRMGRWNSWDLLHHPNAIAADIMEVVKSPLSHADGLVFWVVFSMLIIVCYSLYLVLVNTPRSHFTDKNTNQTNKYF